MKNLISALTILSVLFLAGCGNLSPRNEGRISPKIGGKNNKIDKIQSELKNMQGSLNAELGNVKAENKINAEKLENLQQGNFNTKRDNTGIQIMQGDGVLVLILALAMLTVGCVAIIIYYRDKIQKTEKALNILAQKIAESENPNLEDSIFNTAMHSGAAKEVLFAIKKHKK